MAEKIRLGLAGCGTIMKVEHVPNFLNQCADDIEITALYNRTASKAEAFKEEFKLNAAICTSYEELIARDDVDAVIIASPNNMHYPQTIAALNAGKHVFLEKPMSFSVEQADEMIDLSLKKDLVLHINQSMRFINLYQEIKKRIDEGLVGEISSIRCQRVMVCAPNGSWAKNQDWFIDPAQEGSLVNDIGVHAADYMQYLAGKAVSVSAFTRKAKHPVDDAVYAMFRYENGAVGTLELSWFAPSPRYHIEIYGDKGTLEYNSDGNFDFTPAGRNTKVEFTIKGSDLPKAASSHQTFVSAIRNNVRDAWKAGREAIALCQAIRESNALNAAVVPKNR